LRSALLSCAIELLPSAAADHDAIAHVVEKQWVVQAHGDLLADPERAVWLDQGDQRMPFDPDMGMVLIAQVLDPASTAGTGTALPAPGTIRMCSERASTCLVFARCPAVGSRSAGGPAR
jgi:hypothetical protein